MVSLAAAVALELAAIAVILLRIRRARRGWRAARLAGASTIDALDAALAATGLPARVAGAIATELVIAANIVVGWRAPRSTPTLFTSHRANGWALYAGTFAVLTLVETPVVHLALVNWGHATAAWIASALSLYGAAWLIGDLHALRHGGIALTAEALELRLGVRWRARIPRAAITRATRCPSAPSKPVDLSILGANVLVTLAAPQVVRGLLGRRRELREIALSLDEPDRFLAMISQPCDAGHVPAVSDVSSPG